MRRNYLLPSYFKSFQSICDQYLRPGDVVLDVGAHVGVTGSMMWQKVQPGGSLYAFEPNPEVFNVLQKNIKSNRMERAEAYQVLCGDLHEDVAFFVNPAHTGLSSINRENLFSPGKYLEIKTPMLRLSEFCREKNISPNFIKIDTQGAELEVLKGLKDTLADRSNRQTNGPVSRPLTIYIEFWPSGIERISKVHPAEFLKLCEENKLKVMRSEHFDDFIQNHKIPEIKRHEFVTKVSQLSSQYTNLVLQTMN